MNPETMPPTSFCSAGEAPHSLQDHEPALVALHEQGSLELLDRSGENPEIKRWRVRWGSGSDEVRAVLAVSREPVQEGSGPRYWIYAEAQRPWEIRRQLNVPARLGVTDVDLKDPSSGWSLLQYNHLTGLAELDFLAPVLREEDGLRNTPVLFWHYDPAQPLFNQQMLRFRDSTRGLCGLLPIDDACRDMANAVLPPAQQVPYRAARLYLPSWWVPHAEDIVIEQARLARPGLWRELVDTVVRVSSWRGGGHIPMGPNNWVALLHDGLRDEPVPGAEPPAVRWAPPLKEPGRFVLRDRLGTLREREQQLRDEAAEAEARLAELEGERAALAESIARAQRSRRRLAEWVGRVRRERDAAETALRSFEVGQSWHAAREAATEAALYAEELDLVELRIDQTRERIAALRAGAVDEADEVEEPDKPRFGTFAELLDTARAELPGLVFGPRVDAAAELDGHLRCPQWLRRTWDVLVLLDSYAAARREAADFAAPELRGFAHYVREHGGEHGLSPSLVASGETEMVVNTARFRNARTFPVPTEVDPSGWSFFGAHVKIDRGGGVAPRLHYYDDTAGGSGCVHVGYLGPHLPSPESN